MVVAGAQDATGAQPPAFVQQVSKRARTTGLALQPTANVTAGNRIVVEVGVWRAAGATASAVTDSAGNTYTELTHFTASDNTEMSVWSAPITAGGGTRPTLTVKPSASADVGATVLEYSGLSTAAGIAAVDQSAHATATTGAAAAVSSGPTAPTSAAGELAVGFYADSGFSSTLVPDPAYRVRANVSPAGDMQMLVQDQVLAGAGATPNPITGTGANTPWLAATIVFKSAAPGGPATAPATPGAPAASAGDGQATVSWTAPDDGGSAITRYTVTPYDGSTTLTPTVVSGTPAPTSATVKSVTNGKAYTFTVKATNAIGSSGESAPSSAVTPTAATTPSVSFIQQVSKRGVGSSLALQPASNVAAADRIVVEAGVWSAGAATASSVTDSAGNTYTELTHFKASDNAELSVWSAPVTAGGGTRPTITVSASGSADVGAAALEYAGLSTASGAGVVDQLKTATGKTASAAASVSSGATAPTTAAGELALGFYADSGFSSALAGDPAYTVRTNVSPAGDMQLLVQDHVFGGTGATPNPATTTGANTTWLAATVVLKAAAQSAPLAPSAPGNATATPGAGQATVSWTAPDDGGSAITRYTITPYIGAAAQTPTVISGSPPAASATITGLTNDTTYTFTVTATNAVGTGPASAASNAVTPGSWPGGQWGSLMTWPLVGVHSVLLKSGNMLEWDGWQQPQPTSVWNATSQTFPTTLNAPGSIFCAGNAHLPDGRILVAGGDGVFTTGQLGLADTAIFDPATSAWTKVASMKMPRWYPSLTELADGRYVAISGNSKDSNTWADTPEVYDPAANTWTLLTGVSTPQVHEEEYPFSYLLPSGRIFTIGPSEDNSFLLDVANRTWTPVGGASGVVNGASVMYRPGKVLYAGGAPLIDSASQAKANAAVIDLTAANPAWRSVAPMNHARDYQTLTNLADGTVLAVGGEDSSDQSIVTKGVLPAEVWDPATEKWTDVAPMAAARNYHSTAALMPDGRVLVAGGGHYQDGVGPGQFSAQFYSPPYLFKGARPTISSAPAAATYGSDMTVATPDAGSIRSVNLVNLAADTHQADMDQHFVPLSFTANSGSLTVQAPGNAALAPPGDYMLFIVNDKGVPSVASIVHMSPTLTAPAVPQAPTAVAGDGQANVSWSAPADGGTPITGYKVTPYVGSNAQTPTVVSGGPAPTSAKITGLTDGQSYTFTVSATNAVGSSGESPPSNVVTPAQGASVGPQFLQQASGRSTSGTVGLQLPGSVMSGDRLVVEAGVWSAGAATASAVTDSAGNTYTELTHFKASDNTELSVWTAPVSAGDGTKPAITVSASGKADVGASVLEYSGLSTAAGTGVLDAVKTATGTTGSAATGVSSGATGGSTAAGDLALGAYTDSGFSNSLTGDPTYSVRADVSPAGDIELLAQDKVLAGSATTANAVTNTGPRTPWLAATLLLKAAAPAGGGAMVSAMRVSGAEPAPTAAAKRIYAFPIPRLKRPLTGGVLLLCPLANWAQRLAPQPFRLHPAPPHRRTSRHHPRRRAARRASSSGAARRPGHRGPGGARAR